MRHSQLFPLVGQIALKFWSIVDHVRGKIKEENNANEEQRSGIMLGTISLCIALLCLRLLEFFHSSGMRGNLVCYPLFLYVMSVFISFCEQLHYIYSFLMGYLVGSFPTAYLLVKRKTDLDIRSAGSGNAGAMNVFVVTGSNLLGIAVLLIDLLKGVAAVWLGSLLISKDVVVMGISGLAAVVGHNYSLWLKFRGGRGLATGLGVMLSLGWIFVVLWCSVWGIVYLISKGIHISNIIASIVSPVLLAIVPVRLWEETLPRYIEINGFKYVAVALSILILLRHLEYFLDLKKPFIK